MIQYICGWYKSANIQKRCFTSFFCGYNIDGAECAKANKQRGSIMQTDTKILKVFSKKVAYELRKMGYRILYTEPNRNHPQFDVYVFENKNEIEKQMARIGEQISAKKESKEI